MLTCTSIAEITLTLMNYRSISTLCFFLLLLNLQLWSQNLASADYTILTYIPAIKGPEAIVQKQLDAYNMRDLEAFLDTYSDSIKIYNFPDQLIMDGKEAMKNSYGPMFQSNPNLNCEIVKRIVQGNTVIDQEHVTGLSNGSAIDATAIYRVRNGLIQEVYFVR